MRKAEKFGDWDVIRRKVISSTFAKGYRTGSTCYYLLECGHSYNEPASKMRGRTERECIFCMALWRFLIGESGLINADFALKTINSDTLREMHVQADVSKRPREAR